MARHLKKGKSNAKKIVISIIVVVLVLVGAGAAFGYSILSKINHKDLSKGSKDASEIEAQGVDEFVPIEEKSQKKSDIINIALFGMDRRQNEPCRSDTMMVLSIDKESKTLKLTSLMRDMYVAIPGHESNKLNAAYAFGGPGLAINTINDDFNLDIKYYGAVDFKGLSKLIDKLGGTNIDVKQGEIQYLNSYVTEMNLCDPSNASKGVTKAGMQHLNGKQTVGYMRIRYYGDGDFQRTQRQRTVLTQIYGKIKKQGVLKLPGTISSVLSYVDTNMPDTEIISLATSVLGFNADIQQFRLPLDGKFQYKTIRGMSTLVPDMTANTSALQTFIYGQK